MGSQQFCTFLVDGSLFGVEVEHVQEILRDQPMTPIPLAPSHVRGLINLRGQIVPAIELRRCLQLEDRPPDSPPANVIIRTEDGPVSLLADEIGEVLSLGEETFEEPPANLQGSMRRMIRGVHKLEEGLLMLLSSEAAIAVSMDAGLEGRHGEKPESEAAPQTPLFDRVGGAEAVTAVVEQLHRRLAADPALSAFFEGIDLERLGARQTAFFTQAFGGGAIYSGRPLAEAHRELGIRAEHFDRVAQHLADVLRELGLTPELAGEVLDLVGTTRDEILNRG